MQTLELCFLLILFRASLHITGIVCLGKKVPDLHQAGSMLGNINFIGCENCKSTQENQTDQHKSSHNSLFIIALKSSSITGRQIGHFGCFYPCFDVEPFQCKDFFIIFFCLSPKNYQTNIW